MALVLVALAPVCAFGGLVENQKLGAVDWTTLSLADWKALQIEWALETLFQQGPRVRAKFLVATRLSSQQFFGGSTLFKQQVSGVLNTSLDCVHFEFLETSARDETQQAAFTVAVGISALCPLVGVTSLATNLTTAIERERTRVAAVATDSSTIPSLQLFGVPMTLVDLAVDGELFYPMDFQPWVLAHLIVSSSSTNDSDTEPYLTSNDAFQQLRLRMFLAKHMRPIRVSPNDVIIRTVQLIPDATYSTANTVLISLEIHVLSDIFFEAVDGYLRNQSLVREFQDLEPEFVLRAIDVNVSAGQLYDPVESSVSSNAGSTLKSLYQSLEFSFAVSNATFAYLESRKWRILERTRTALTSRVDDNVALDTDKYDLSFGRLISNDDDTSDIFGSRNWMLSFRLALSKQNINSPVLNASAIGNLDLPTSLGFQEPSDSNTIHVSFSSLQIWPEPYGNMRLSPPFVRFTITIALATAGIETNQPMYMEQDGSARLLDFFQQQRIRFALMAPLKQVHVTDAEQLVLVGMRPGSLTADHVTASVELAYDIAVQDESQREGIKIVALSQRLELLISKYSNNQMRVSQRRIDLHADGSPAPSKNFVLPGTCSEYNTIQPEEIPSPDFVYRFDDPTIDSNPAILSLNEDTPCEDTQKMCVVLTLSSFLPTNESIFVRQIDSTSSFTSTSLLLRPSSANSTTSLPAPWIEFSTSGSSMAPWVFSMDVNRNPSHAMRFWLEPNNSSSNWTYLLDIRWNESQLWISSNLIQSSLREPTAVPIRSENDRILLLVNDSAKTASEINLDVQIISHTCLGVFCIDTSEQPECSTCADAMNVCGDSVECRALASCFGSFITANPLLYFELYKNLQMLDITFVLTQCLVNSWWSDVSRQLFLRAFQCGIQKACGMGMSSTLKHLSALVFGYKPKEQTLAFASESFQTSLGLLVDSVDGTSTATLSLRNFTSEETSLNRLQTSLLGIYGNHSNGMAINVTLERDESASTSTSWTVRIQYYFLPSNLQLPYFMVEQGDSPSINTTRAADSLEVSVIM